MRWTAALLILAACSAQAPPAEQTPSSTATSPTGYPSPNYPSPGTATVVEKPAPAARVQNITIERVEVGNPLVVTGRARTFENNVALRVRGSDGTVIAEGFTTSRGEMGNHNPYAGSLWLTRDPGPRVIVEALEYSAKDGSEQSLVRMEKPFPVEPVRATLYFADQQCSAVKPYERSMPKSVSMARLLVEALMAGPTEAERSRGAEGSFPKGSAVNSVNLRGGVLTVDFNERLQNVGGSCRVAMIRSSVNETLQRLDTVQRVVITAGGSEKLALQP